MDIIFRKVLGVRSKTFQVPVLNSRTKCRILSKAHSQKNLKFLKMLPNQKKRFLGIPHGSDRRLRQIDEQSSLEPISLRMRNQVQSLPTDNTRQLSLGGETQKMVSSPTLKGARVRQRSKGLRNEKDSKKIKKSQFQGGALTGVNSLFFYPPGPGAPGDD